MKNKKIIKGVILMVFLTSTLIMSIKPKDFQYGNIIEALSNIDGDNDLPPFVKPGYTARVWEIEIYKDYTTGGKVGTAVGCGQTISVNIEASANVSVTTRTEKIVCCGVSTHEGDGCNTQEEDERCKLFFVDPNQNLK